MTVEEPNAPVAVEETPVTETKAIEETNVTGNKRAFDEIQARAAVTIHDLADEDEEDDPDYKESDAEEDEEEAAVEASAAAAADEEANDAEEEDEEEEEEDDDEEDEEDISVEELTGVIEDAGLGEAPKAEELAVKVLRGGKKIVREEQLESAAAPVTDSA